MGQDEGKKFLETIDTIPGTAAVPDDKFDDSFDQIKQQ